MSKINELVGDPNVGDSSVGRYSRSNPGVSVPLRIVVTNDEQQTLYDSTRDTYGHYAAGRLRLKRRAGGLTLSPGLYQVHVKSTEGIPEMSGMQTEFAITYDGRF
jgi:hypothetical protein